MSSGLGFTFSSSSENSFKKNLIVFILIIILIFFIFEFIDEILWFKVSTLTRQIIRI